MHHSPGQIAMFAVAHMLLAGAYIWLLLTRG